MKKVLIAVMIVLLFASVGWSLEGSDGQKLKGNHFTLNIIGVQNPKTADMDSDTGKGSTIFVNLGSKEDGGNVHSKIGLVESGSADAPMVEPDEFAVLDKNGTDGDGALFALPNPQLDPYIVGEDLTDVDTDSYYSIYVRPLGKPLGYATITTCAELVDSKLITFLESKKDYNAVLEYYDILNEDGWFGGYASIEQVGSEITFRNKGKTTFTNVTAELTTIVLAIQILSNEGDVVLDTFYARIPIFDPVLQGEYWDYDNNGLKLLQVRFYPWSTDVSAGDGELPDLPAVLED